MDQGRQRSGDPVRRQGRTGLSGGGTLLCAVGREAGNAKPLSIDVTYDRTRLAQDDIATATATVKNNLPKTANMVMVDLGIPPGFDLLSEDLQAFQEKTADAKSGRLEKFSLTATQAILYFDSIAPRDSFEIRYRLRAKYPIHAQGFAITGVRILRSEH